MARVRNLSELLAPINRLVKAVIDFAISTTDEQGKPVSRDADIPKSGIGLANTGYVHTIREFHDSKKGFSYRVEIGRPADIDKSLRGGNTVAICYHPGCQYEKKMKPFLIIEWEGDIKNYRLAVCAPGEWWEKLRKVIGAQKKISAWRAKKGYAASKGESSQEQLTPAMIRHLL